MRDKQILVKLSAEEKAKIESLAKDSGLSISEYIRLRALDEKVYTKTEKVYTSEPQNSEKVYTSDQKVYTQPCQTKPFVRNYDGPLTKQMQSNNEINALIKAGKLKRGSELIHA